MTRSHAHDQGTCTLVNLQVTSIRVLACFATWLVPATAVWAQSDLSFDVGLTEEYTDNATLSATNAESDLISRPRFGLVYSRQSSRTDADIDFHISRNIYKNGTQDDQTIPLLNARVNWQIVKEQFSWTLEDFATQNQIDVTTAPTSDNTQNVNTFITGPNLSLRFGQSEGMELGARYGDSNFEVTDQDSTHAVGFVRFFHEPSSLSTLSLSYNFSSINFAEPSNPDFDRQDLFFQFRAQRVRSNAVFDIGATVIDREDIDDKGAHPLFRLSWERRLTGRSTLGLLLARIESDSGLNLAIAGTAPPDLRPGGTVANTPDIFTDKRLNLFYRNTGRRTTTTVSLFARDQDFRIDDASDQLTIGTTFNLGRRMTPKLVLSFVASYSSNEFTELIPTRTDRDTNAELGFSYRLGRQYALTAGIRWQNRDSTDSAAEYTETRAILGITYSYANIGATETSESFF